MNIKKLAEEAGVSTATVSRAFSHRPNVRPDVRKKILTLAKKYNYHPRIFAKLRNIVIISPYTRVYPVQSYVEMVITELTHYLSLSGFRVEILHLDSLEDVSQLAHFQFCGAVAISVDPAFFQSWSELFAVPLVLIDRPLPAAMNEVYSIRSDEEGAMELAVDCFARTGVRKIGTIIYGRENDGNTRLRANGVLAALKKHHYPVSDSLIKFALEENYVELIGQMLKQGIDALFCPGGNAGMIASYALSLFNKRIPDDISLIASERTVFSRYMTPPQTTISQDYSILAEYAVRIIDARLQGCPQPQETVLPYKLIRRNSTK